MIMVRRDIKAERYDNPEYLFSVITILPLPSTHLGFFLAEKIQPIFQQVKEKVVGAFISPYIYFIEAFFQVLFEDGTKKDCPYALKRQANFAPDDSFWKGIINPDEYRPQDREKEEEVLLQIIKDLKAKGYYAQEENLIQFFNRKADKLFLELSEGGNPQENLQPTA